VAANQARIMTTITPPAATRFDRSDER